MLDMLKSLAGPGADPDVLAFYLEAATDAALSYCNRSDLPPGLQNLVVQWALEAWRDRDGAVQSLSEGDASVTYAQAAHGAGSVLRDARARLNPYRRLGTLS